MKTLIVGMGQMGQYYLKKLREQGEKPSGIILLDHEPGRLLSFAEQGYRCVGAVSELLAGEVPRVAIVAVNTPGHAETLTALLQAGVQYILCEKPLTMTLAEGKQVVDLAADRSSEIFVAFLIQFSPALTRLKEFMVGNDLLVVEASNRWGKNRIGNKRPSPGDLTDETCHGQDVIRSLVGINRTNEYRRTVTSCQTLLAFVPDEEQRAAHNRDASFPDRPDASTQVLEIYTFSDGSRLGVSHHSSFVWPSQVRRIEVTLVDAKAPLVPRYHAVLEFDTPNGDRLQIFDLQGKSAAFCNEVWLVDKLREQLEAFYRVVTADEVDGRLTTARDALEELDFVERVRQSSQA